MEATNTLAEKRSLIPMLLLISLFALPTLGGWFFFLNPGLIPQGQTNKGTLITPQRPVTKLTLKNQDGTVFNWDNIKDYWTMTIIHTGDCDNKCIAQLTTIRQLRRALAGNRQRIKRLLIMLPNEGKPLSKISIADEFSGTEILFANQESASQVRRLFNPENLSLNDQLYLIDPRLAYMMRHDTKELPAKHILKDLETLLTASQNWVTGVKNGH